MEDDQGRRVTRKTIKGPVREQVSTNIRHFRKEVRGWTLDQLSARLVELGHPLVPTAVHKIEQGERKPDVDDLVAFALALDVSPVALLLPHRRNQRVQLTANQDAKWQDGWRWATGEQPLENLRLTDPRVRQFRRANRPYETEQLRQEAIRTLIVQEQGPFEAVIGFDGNKGIGTTTAYTEQEIDK